VLNAFAAQQISDTTLSRDDLGFIAQIVYEHAGIVIREHKEAMARGRLSRRVKALGMNSIAEYCAFLRRPEAADEITDLINALTTNHTAFFRERHHFDHLRRDALPALLRPGGMRNGRIRIWSAACSSGEEPYSIAAIVRDVLGDRPGLDLRILATDIDTDILVRARAGSYSRDTIERMPSDLKPLLLHEVARTGDDCTVSPRLKQFVTFNHLNLIERWPMRGAFDMIFCRNVFIYFDSRTKAAILDHFVELMHVGGWLYLGHSESLSQPHPRLRLIGRTIYEKTK
jgi:chemotaxis protein methyltransferase CheR